jgi:UDP-3-O-[3-hydroxymyristoyl] N-acetylglucosamine deacetylase
MTMADVLVSEFSTVQPGADSTFETDENASFRVSGTGLITGKPVAVTIVQAEAGHGVIFYPESWQGEPIPARLPAVVHTDRGVTLANRAGQTLSIVEHFLAGAILAGFPDLKVLVQSAPELPILDGSAQDWMLHFNRQSQWQKSVLQPIPAWKQAVFYRANEDIAVYGIPDTHFKVTYAVDFNHPELRNRHVHWDSQTDAPSLVSTAGTFGYVSELPALQARGLALGVNESNSLGLFEEGGYSRPLRHDDEPVYHKILDLIGDLSLTGLNPLALPLHVFAINAGHSSHVAFGKRLLKALAHE